MSPRKKIFISYAHGDTFKRRDKEGIEVEVKVGDEVRKLAQWLNKQEGIEVVSDHIHSDCPPEEGWYTWMSKKIKEADVVLCACGEAYQRGLEKEGDGLGVPFEGAIITRAIYTARSKNRKFYPLLLPQENADSFVPDLLAPWNNGIALTDRKRILALIKAALKVLKVDGDGDGDGGGSKGMKNMPEKKIRELTKEVLKAYDDNKQEDEICELIETTLRSHQRKRLFMLFALFVLAVAVVVVFALFFFGPHSPNGGDSKCAGPSGQNGTAAEPQPNEWRPIGNALSSHCQEKDGNYVCHVDGNFDLCKARWVRITFAPNQAGKKFVLRLVPEGADFDKPIGVRWELIQIPANEDVVQLQLPLKAEAFGLKPEQMGKLVQIGVLSGDNAWGRPLQQDASKQASFERIEVQ
jgi:hypothetical protein